jgi:hypothetical protein
MPRNSLALLMALMLVAGQRGETWSRLRQIDPSLALLSNPGRLLILASSYAGPTGKPYEHPDDPTVETRHEALRALLSLQSKRFDVSLPAVVKTTGIDHVLVKALSTSNNLVRLVATPSRLPDRKATEGDYWNLEVLAFDKSGRLLSRGAYKEHDE